MSDLNYAHEYDPRRKDGKCKVMVGGRKQGYRSCHELEDAEVHQRWEPPCSDGLHNNVRITQVRETDEGIVIGMHCDDCGLGFEKR